MKIVAVHLAAAGESVLFIQAQRVRVGMADEHANPVKPAGLHSRDDLLQQAGANALVLMRMGYGNPGKLAGALQIPWQVKQFMAGTRERGGNKSIA